MKTSKPTFPGFSQSRTACNTHANATPFKALWMAALGVLMAGFKGNGHMLMIEMNHFEIAQHFEKWLQQNIR